MIAVYLWMYGAIGALSPFLSVYYRSLGLSGTQTSILLSIMPVLLFLSQPIFGPLTDRSGHRGRMLAWLLVLAAICGGAIGFGHTFATIAVLVSLWAFFAGPLVAITDSIALGEVSRTGSSYARYRLWGSVGFLVATTLFGRLYASTSLIWIFPLYTALILVTAYFARRLPAEGMNSRKPIWPELRRLVSNPYLVGFLFFTGLMQSTYSAHSAFFSVHLLSIGGTSTTVGLGWAIAALMEVPVWWYLGKIQQRTGPLPLLIAAGAVFAVRWWLYSVIPSPTAVLGLQALQGASFALFLPTAVVVVGELTPPELRTSGQGLLALVNGGIATIVGTLGAGWVVDNGGTALLYRVMAYGALASGVGFLVLMLGRRTGAHTEGITNG